MYCCYCKVHTWLCPWDERKSQNDDPVEDSRVDFVVAWREERTNLCSISEHSSKQGDDDAAVGANCSRKPRTATIFKQKSKHQLSDQRQYASSSSDSLKVLRSLVFVASSCPLARNSFLLSDHLFAVSYPSPFFSLPRVREESTRPSSAPAVVLQACPAASLKQPGQRPRQHRRRGYASSRPPPLIFFPAYLFIGCLSFGVVVVCLSASGRPPSCLPRPWTIANPSGTCITLFSVHIAMC
uniref:Transmembrane protein n=1 Tax=Panagrellus redivivus TaxID=6233 RepID=A0A7E4ZT54_PANRE